MKRHTTGIGGERVQSCVQSVTSSGIVGSAMSSPAVLPSVAADAEGLASAGGGLRICVAALNCGKSCGSSDGVAAVICAIQDILPVWTVIYLSEIDALRSNSPILQELPHKISRHYPGTGSFPMAFVINQRVACLVQKVLWRGRCGAVVLFQAASPCNECIHLFIVGIHNSHKDLQVDVLNDAAFLIRNRPWGSKVVFIGDFNVDQLPALAVDPFADLPGRYSHHSDERLRLTTFADKFGLDLEIPEMVVSTPGGPFGDMCAFAPISRIPAGEQASTMLPSCLDYCMASPNLVQTSEVHWEGVPADHALVAFTVDAAVVCCNSGKRRGNAKMKRLACNG